MGSLVVPWKVHKTGKSAQNAQNAQNAHFFKSSFFSNPNDGTLRSGRSVRFFDFEAYKNAEE